MAVRKRTRKQSVKVFASQLRAAWVSDLESEPAPVMPELDAALARLRSGGAA